MSRDVSGELPSGPVPAAVPLRLRVKTRALPKKGEHTFGLKLEQIRSVKILRLLQWTARQSHVTQRQRDSLELNLGRNTRGMREGKRLKRAKKNHLAELLHTTSNVESMHTKQYTKK